MSCRKNKDNEQALGCCIWMILLIILAPFVGIYLIGKNSPTLKVLGVMLTVISGSFWIWFLITKFS